MKDSRLTDTLLVETHAAIAAAAEAAVGKIGVSLRKVPHRVDTAGLGAAERKLVAAIRAGIAKMTLTYPPEQPVLTPSEEKALQGMRLASAERRALQKLFAEACHSTMFRFFCLMDAVGHPEVMDTRTWLGARFTARQEGDMLHDRLGELYWKYKAATGASSGNGKPRVKARAKRKRRAPQQAVAAVGRKSS